MNTAAKLSAYCATLAVLAGGAYATGSAVGPLTPAPVASAGHGGPFAAQGSGSMEPARGADSCSDATQGGGTR
jgi:hypothetical protein